MEQDLDALDARIQALIGLTEGLRSEISELRQGLATSQAENAVLKDKVATARVRLEALLARIPADDEEETSP
jgi:cell division protein ZapB